ncbi:MAG: 30S ribosomal protein S20 [Rickettsiales bacterium]|nr:30S ribosomal protein S20 [Rickettsiales bacterium]
MANIKSAKKNIRVIDRRTAVNKSRKSKARTLLRKTADAVNEKKEDLAKENLVEFESQIMRCVSKGVYKKNTASRKVGKLARRVNSLG